jgi:hypothetical protein
LFSSLGISPLFVKDRALHAVPAPPQCGNVLSAEAASGIGRLADPS